MKDCDIKQDNASMSLANLVWILSCFPHQSISVVHTVFSSRVARRGYIGEICGYEGQHMDKNKDIWVEFHTAILVIIIKALTWCKICPKCLVTSIPSIFILFRYSISTRKMDQRMAKDAWKRLTCINLAIFAHPFGPFLG